MENLETQATDTVYGKPRNAYQSFTGPQTGEITIDLVELCYYLISKWYYILLGTVLCIAAFAAFGMTREPIYTATASLYILGENENDKNDYSDFQVGAALAVDYQEVFNAWEVHEMVNQQIGSNFSNGELQKMLTVTNPSGTRLLNISIENTNPQLAADIANAYVTAAKIFIVQSMDTDEPRTFSLAQVPVAPSSAGVGRYAIYGLLVGAVLAVGILLLVFFMDNRPKSTEDILQFGIPILAVIPENLYLSGKAPKKRRKR